MAKPSRPRVARDPDICGGAPVIEGTRWNTDIVLAGWVSRAEILASYPWITEAQVDAAIRYERGIRRRFERFLWRTVRGPLAAWLLGTSVQHLENEALIPWTVRGEGENDGG